MIEPLRACFHCGKDNITDYRDEGVLIARCKDCGFELPFDEWNIRPVEDALKEDGKRLAKMVGELLEENYSEIAVEALRDHNRLMNQFDEGYLND
jgi:hypothetical protein